MLAAQSIQNNTDQKLFTRSNAAYLARWACPETRAQAGACSQTRAQAGTYPQTRA